MSETLMAHWKSKRNMAHKRLNDAVACARNCVSNPELITRLETWCSRMDVILEGFNEAHINVVCEMQKAGLAEKEVQAQMLFQEQADDMHFEVLEAKRKYLKESKVGSSYSSQPGDQTKSRTKLPPMKLPTFTGQFKDFPGFIDLFNTLVHQRTDLTNVEKFQYLITTLAGEPINIIRAFPVSEINYVSAYEALVNRYNNKRYLAFMCWEQINNLKAMHSGSAQSLRVLLDVYGENIAMLTSLGLPTSEWDFVLFHSLLTKLDKQSREAFELSSTGKDFPSFNELKSFLLERCSALERSSLSNVTANSSAVQQQNNNHNKRVNLNNQSRAGPTMLLASSNNQVCVLCKENHALYSCTNFLSKSPQERAQAVKQYKLCFNCLRSNHITTNCTSNHLCKICNQRHNSLLHFPKKAETSGSVNPQHKQGSAISCPTTSNSNRKDDVITPVTSLSNVSSGPTSGAHFVMLATAEVEVKDGRGTFQKVRILLDPGSQSHIITKACARRLGLTQYKTQTPMAGIGEVPACSKSKVFLEIRPVGKLEPSFTTEAVTLDKICGNMPTHQVNVEHFEHLSNLKLADENYHSSRPVDILIGGEIFPQILLPGKIDGGHHAATAINTIFGFILMGKTLTNSSHNTPLSINHVAMDTNLDIAVQRFWELDNIPSGDNKQSQSVEDIQCEDIFQSTHKRDADGRYIVHLPFRDPSSPSFEKSHQMALRRFVQLEKRLLAKPEFHEKYKQHVMEYLSSDQMERVPASECQSPTAYYLAHHAVFKSDRDLRVVYDASAKDSKGNSLNDTLLTGPKLQADITNILLRFRLHAIVFTADVRQMYRQISVAEEHRDFQRILFRCYPDEPIEEYKLNRVTFGVSSAPFLAIRVIHQLAHDEGDSFPDAAQVLLEDIYVDDVVTGCQNLEQAVNLQQQLKGIMAAGGFELRKWSSNHAAVLQNIPEDHKAVPNINQTFDSDALFVKVLGLAWNSQEDIFNYQVNTINRECTKRTMLSELARIYDPIGLLTPLTFLAKHLIQRLWLLGSSWDQPVPDDIHQIWSKYSQQLPHLSLLQIQRRITADDAVCYQLHGYSDASEAGYAAVVYLRSTSHHNQHQVALVSARSRVSPTKRRTLPRLELCGAALLADLMRYVRDIYSKVLTIESVNMWTDSMIVLSWIKSNSTNFKAFVGNRISSIQRKLPEAVWKHVPGKQNPADCASRGLTPDELVNHDQWWTGPKWLSMDQKQWPTEPRGSDATSHADLEVNCEKRACILNVTNIGDTHPIEHLLNKFSSLRKIQRVLAYCYRFMAALRKNKRSGHCTEQELHQTLMVIVKHIQQLEFGEEIKQLRSNRVLPKPFRKLNPFLDQNHILRVGGRLSQSDLSYESKHPALLPRKHRLTQLLIQAVHNENFHPGLQTMQFLLLQNFWILSSRRAVHQIISNCYRCFRVKPHNFEPEMADLPRSRVTQIKAFQSVGCDYAGPFNITFQRYRGARSMKAYLCLFVCFATKALHLELASDLSTEAFLAALRRFIARRGRCNVIHSDCGTNFKGAQSQLRDLMRSACETEHIEFKFNPPGAPHFGGLWEAGVKSVKTHLYRVIGTQILTYEELNTLLTQVESILNTRPLCPISSDPSDLSVLTPGHFLTLAPLTTVPSPDYTNINMNRLTRWQLLQKMHQDFWSRWHREYLTTLSQRLKWTKASPPVNIDQLVIIKNETTHPLRWQFGRIIKLYPGRDGIPRSASVKTAQGVFDRPLVKLCPLPNTND